MGTKLWRASSPGPDWMDVISVLKAVEGVHGVLVTIGMHGTPGPGLCSVWHISAMQADKDASVLGNAIVDLSGEWPCPDHMELTACLYAGLLRLDHELGSKYVQQKL